MALAAKLDSMPEAEEPQVKPVAGKSRMIILGVIVAVVLLEVLLLYFMLPGPQKIEQDVRSLQNEQLKDDVKIKPDFQPDLTDALTPVEQIEFPLEDPFMCEVNSEDSSTTVSLRARFVFKYNKADEKEFTKRYTAEKNNIRYEILRILRNSSLRDINDPTCTVIRNKILKRVNEVLREPLVKSVIYTEFIPTMQ